VLSCSTFSPTGSPTVAKGRVDTGEHPVHHRPGNQVTIGNVRLARDRQLVPVIGGPHSREPNRFAPAAERH
jgi:hypothetical protein